jgi:FixJ family two-component response regulator
MLLQPGTYFGLQNRSPHCGRASMPTKRCVVAVIDDNLDILGALGRLLSTLGYDTELYASKQEFLDAAMNSEAICLIVDVHLGPASGIDLAQELSSAGYTFPTIFMSGDKRESIKMRAMKVGAVAFLTKPFCADVLIEALAKVPPRRAIP